MSHARVIAGCVLFYIIMFVCLGIIGQSSLDELDVNSTVGDSLTDLNSSSEIGILDLPGFISGISFSISGLPWYIDAFLTIPLIMMLVTGWQLIRGN